MVKTMQRRDLSGNYLGEPISFSIVASISR
jgi:hypothetical protein